MAHKSISIYLRRHQVCSGEIKKYIVKDLNKDIIWKPEYWGDTGLRCFKGFIGGLQLHLQVFDVRRECF
jgi:hypothetical protein